MSFNLNFKKNANDILYESNRYFLEDNRQVF